VIPLPQYPTLGSIARHLDEPPHRIRYIIDSRKIAPAGKAGNARVFTQADVDLIRAELAQMDEQREASHD